MAVHDKVLLMHRVEETLKPRMFANLFEEATEQIQEHLEDFDVTYTADSSSETDNYINEFIGVKRTEGLSEKTLVAYQYTIERFLKWCKVSSREVTTEHIRSYIQHEQERGIQDSTLKGVRQRLNPYFTWLERERHILVNPVNGVSPIKCEEKVREAFLDTDIKRIERVANVRDLAIVCFLLSTGCRISEMVALNRDDIDFNENELIVFGKGKKNRLCYLDGVAAMTLREYLATRKDDNPALFVGLGNKRFQAGGVRVMMNRLSKKTGVENIHPHRFRRTMITTRLDRGMPIQEVAILVGHSNVDVTMHYYSASKSRIKSSFIKYSGR